jgi:hypothetical protein
VRLPGGAPRRTPRPSAPTTTARATTRPRRSPPPWRPRATPSGSARPPRNCGTWRRRWTCGRRCPRPNGRRATASTGSR